MRLLLAALAVALVAACGSDATPLENTRTIVAGGPSPTLGTQPIVAIDGVRLDDPATLSTASPDVERLRSAARADDRRTVLVMSNYSPDVGGYSGDLARAMLADAVARRAVVEQLVDAAATFDGVQVSFSGLAAPDAAPLVTFIRAVRDGLPAGAELTLTVVASTDFGGYRERGYDIEALESLLDRVVLQAYEPGGADLTPQPLGDAAGIEDEIDYLTSQVDADRIDLGITPGLGLTRTEATRLADDAGLHGVVLGARPE